MKISILIPCHNEEKSIRKCVQCCLDQTRKADQIVVVNDGSTDRSGDILAEFGKQIEVVTIPKATGNKSRAQEYGLRYVTGDVFIATDGDTIFDSRFVECVEEDFKDPGVHAVAGYIKSLQSNWLTACRELDYIIGQDFHKVAQSELGFLFVIPGCAGAFRTTTFKNFINFQHDTLTEDLDFTYRLHSNGLKIKYDRRAIAYTQDPDTLLSYINQMRRWYSGGWQNLLKHGGALRRPSSALELSLMYIEGIIFSIVLFTIPLINILLFLYLIVPYLLFQAALGIYGATQRKRHDLLIYSPFYILLTYINAYVFLEQFVREIIVGRRNTVWYQPDRREIV